MKSSCHGQGFKKNKVQDRVYRNALYALKKNNYCSMKPWFAYVYNHWCWEGLRAGGEGDDRGWDGWMASLNWWMWVWVNSGSWWWTRRPGVLRFMGSQRVRHGWMTELNWTEIHAQAKVRAGRQISRSKMVNVFFKDECQSFSLSCLALCDPMDHSPPGSSVHGILKARILEWVAIPFSRGSSWPRDHNKVSCITGPYHQSHQESLKKMSDSIF